MVKERDEDAKDEDDDHADGPTLAFLAALSALTWLGVRRPGVREEGPTDWLEVVDLGREGQEAGRWWGGWGRETITTT